MWSKLSFTIQDYIKQRGLESSFKENSVCMAWKGVVDEIWPGASRYSSAKEVQDNILRVSVHQPIWIGELEGNKKLLIEKIIKRTQFPIQNIMFSYHSKV